MDKKKIAVIGGGTGSVSILNGIKQYSDLEISVIVSMMDDGGSNKVVRDEFGLLPLSDLRKSIIALARGGNGMFRELFTYRFDKGEGLEGHTLGNLIMMALSDITGSEMQAVREAGKIFNVVGRVYPVTFDDVRLVAEYSDGTLVKGEHLIDEPEEFDPSQKIERLFLSAPAKANTEAVSAIKNADFIVIGPGDLYTSLIPNLLVEGIPEAIYMSKGKFILVNNLMTKLGQTHWMKGSELVLEIEKYASRVVDIVIQNTQKIPEDVLAKYLESGEKVMEDNLGNLKREVVRADLIGEREITRSSGDTLVRSLIRHDSRKLAEVLYKIFNN